MLSHPTSKLRYTLTRRALFCLSGMAVLMAACDARKPGTASLPEPSATAISTASPTLLPTRAETAAITSMPGTQSQALTTPPAPTETDVATPAPTMTAEPTATAVPATVERPSRASIMRIYPTVQSRVVSVHWPGAVGSDLLPVSQDVVANMLDAAIRQLTGLADAGDAWRLLFDAHERVAIKVNTIAGSRFFTHVQVVFSIVQRLMEAGLAAEQIVIYDRSSSELQDAGYVINQDGPGVRCYGTDGRYTAGWRMIDTPVALSEILLGCDALINVPVLKQHSIAGISYAMKNHYGTLDKPSAFHGQRAGQGLAELNALDPIRARTRLIVGDALTVCTRNWNVAAPGDRLLVSFDPVATDTIALDLFTELARADGVNPASAQALARRWLDAAGSLKLGANADDQIELVEEELA